MKYCRMDAVRDVDKKGKNASIDVSNHAILERNVRMFLVKLRLEFIANADLDS
jgi:hypothetical protein